MHVLKYFLSTLLLIAAIVAVVFGFIYRGDVLREAKIYSDKAVVEIHKRTGLMAQLSRRIEHPTAPPAKVAVVETPATPSIPAPVAKPADVAPHERPAPTPPAPAPIATLPTPATPTPSDIQMPAASNQSAQSYPPENYT
ncbi:MAG: hypothetical protein HQL37_14870, partial [Alphaproteobacteria bacterium]|nr:hypothetical protein [Alphaproteobacteria bacterium]